MDSWHLSILQVWLWRNRKCSLCPLLAQCCLKRNFSFAHASSSWTTDWAACPRCTQPPLSITVNLWLRNVTCWGWGTRVSTQWHKQLKQRKSVKTGNSVRELEEQTCCCTTFFFFFNSIGNRFLSLINKNVLARTKLIILYLPQIN